MPARRTLGYSISAAQLGLASDREYLNAPDGVRREVMSWVVKLGLKAKDQELAAGLDRFGEPLIPIAAETRKYRESEQGPASSSAPPLMPAFAVSRTRLLLEGDVSLGKAPRSDAADFTWGYDPKTGGSWGEVLKYHAAGRGRYGRIPKRDVLGLSPDFRASVRLAVMSRWQLYKLHRARGTVKRIEPAPAVPAPRLRVIGRTDYEHFTYGIGANAATGAETSRRALAQGGSTGMFQFKAGGGQPAFGGPRNRLPGAYLPEPPLKASGFWKGAQRPPRVAPKPAPVPATVQLAPAAPGLTFARSAPAKEDREPTVTVQVRAVDAAWRRDGRYYIPPGGGGDLQKYLNALEFVRKAMAEGVALLMPRITVDADGAVSFGDGRHRFAAMRDLGFLRVPVSVDKTQAARARRLYGARVTR